MEKGRVVRPVASGGRLQEYFGNTEDTYSCIHLRSLLIDAYPSSENQCLLVEETHPLWELWALDAYRVYSFCPMDLRALVHSVSWSIGRQVHPPP